MPSKAILILRSARRARLEGRKGVSPPSSEFFPSLNALFDLLRRAGRHIGEERS